MINQEDITKTDISERVEKLELNLNNEPRPFNKDEHNADSRLSITKLFLKWYFSLIAGAFLFTGLYNFFAADFNNLWGAAIPYLEVTNTVSIITTTLSSGVGFVIGYYFKNKEDH